MDLYSDLEELRGMTRLLIDDVSMLRPKIAEGNPDPSDDEKAYRRFYVRAVFGLVEAFVEQHRRLVIHLCEAGKIELRQNKLNQLREIKRILDAGGAVVGEEPNCMGYSTRSRRSTKRQLAASVAHLRLRSAMTIGVNSRKRWKSETRSRTPRTCRTAGYSSHRSRR